MRGNRDGCNCCGVFWSYIFQMSAQISYIYLLQSSVALIYRCISINLNVVEKLIYFSNLTQIVKLVY